ncbi:MAG: Npt1/Npt2 family nucleotide transporter [Prochlorotrichaceae cyanobacterium]|jgi:HEAT repeat protein
MTTVFTSPTTALNPSVQRLLGWLNLRPEELERTGLLFASYMAFSIGMSWLEASSIALFLGRYGAALLPWVAIATALTGSGLGIIYSRLQRVLPLRQVVVMVPLVIPIVLLILRFGLSVEVEVLPGLTFAAVTIFLLKLWAEAIYTIADLNTSITANQLFNIREIKRTYSLVSSGILVADIFSGFTLPLLLRFLGSNNQNSLYNVIIFSSLMMILGTGISLHLTNRYRQSFPDAPRRSTVSAQIDVPSRQLKGPLRQYSIILVIFFVISQLLFNLIEFQFFEQLDNQFDAERIAAFLGLFNGFLGIFEITTQWFLSSRLIERWGVFITASILPAIIVLLGGLSLVDLITALGGLLFLKFFDELLRYTLVASVDPVLYQTIPDHLRNPIQAIRGISTPLATGSMGVIILLTLGLSDRYGLTPELRARIFLFQTVFFGLGWIISIFFLRQGYVKLLVMSAERGQLSDSQFDKRAMKQAVIKALENQSPEAEKRSCIELLSQLYPESIGEALSPLLVRLPPKLVQQSLEAMLAHPDVQYVDEVKQLLRNPNLQPEVLAVALRYVWLTQDNPDLTQLRSYLRAEVDPMVRGTAAALMLRLGTAQQRAEATQALRRMLTHQKERERVMGCKALGDAQYMQALRIYIPQLLQDRSLRVRRAILKAIAATHLEEYYSSLIRGLYYASTWEAAMEGLVSLENEVLGDLTALATAPQKPPLVKLHAWNTIGQIGTLEALDELVLNLTTSWGATRRNILRILLKLPHERGINAVLDRLDGRRGVESLIDQELILIGQIYAALVDLARDTLAIHSPSQAQEPNAGELLRRALRYQRVDGLDRMFLLLRFLCPSSAIQAAAYCLQSDIYSNIARGIEILDNTLDIPHKQALLTIVDRRIDQEKLQSLSELVPYTPMPPAKRLRYLLELRHFLDDWPLACCFHLAREARWSLTSEHTLACIRHPTDFVREAVLSYLTVASPRALLKLLPLMQGDSAPLVAGHARKLLKRVEEHRRLKEAQDNPG